MTASPAAKLLALLLPAWAGVAPLIRAHGALFLGVVVAPWAALTSVLLARRGYSPQESLRETFFQLMGCNFFWLFACYRAFERLALRLSGVHFQTADWIAWFFLVGTFLLFSLSYVERRPAVATARGAREVWFPLFCFLLPFAVTTSPAWTGFPWVRAVPGAISVLEPFRSPPPEGLRWASAVFLFVSDAVLLAGSAYLRGSFSVMTEARPVVRDGPYRYVRHPLYLGEGLATAGFFLWWPSAFNLAATLLFIGCQALRASFEEEKLASVFPEYADYRRKTGAVFPRL